MGAYDGRQGSTEKKSAASPTVQPPTDPVLRLSTPPFRHGAGARRREARQAAMTAQSNADTLITIFGGSGFLGRHLVQALAQRQFRIRIAVRRPDLAGHLQPLGRVGQIHVVQANVRHRPSVAAAVRGSDVVINLVGILFESGRQRFEAVQSFGAEAIALAAAAHSVRMIHVSAIGADENSSAAYARAKARGEQLVLAATPDATIFRPSILFGPNDDFFNRFAAIARWSPVLPLVGGGHTRFQPVYAGDVAEAIAKAVEGTTRPGAIYELGGPEVFTFKALMEFVLATIERRRLLLPLPFGLARLQATVFELVSKLPLRFLSRPLLTRDQVELLRYDNVVSDTARREGRTLEGLEIAPQSIAAIVPTYLWRFRKSGQFHDRVA
jgi:NADH dehydrogenase